MHWLQPQATGSRGTPIGWNQNDYDVLEDGVSVGRIFCRPARFVLDLRSPLAETKKLLRQSIRMALS
jgi:hypothetical protein